MVSQQVCGHRRQHTVHIAQFCCECCSRNDVPFICNNMASITQVLNTSSNVLLLPAEPSIWRGAADWWLGQ
jgi:hypothetical protein